MQAADSAMDLSVVIPVYGAERTLEELVARLVTVLDELALHYEIVFIDDGSRDQSWSVLVALQKKYTDRIVAIQLMKNSGQHNAIMCGLRQTRGQYVLTMDDDLQHPPEEIPKMLQGLKQSGLDLVYGKYRSKQHSSHRNLGSSVVNTFYRVVFGNRVVVTSFRLMTRSLVQGICVYDLNFTFVDGLLAWNTDRIGAVEVEHNARQEGRSGYSFRKLLTLALNLFTNFSLMPLQLVSLLGLAASVAGFLGGAYYLIQYFFSKIMVPGYASVIVAILVLGGLQLLSLGVIGEYLGRVHLNINRRPQFRMRQVVDERQPASDEASESN